MSKDYIIMLSPSSPKGEMPWDAGDPVILDGMYVLLPELYGCKTVYSSRIPGDEIDEYVQNARYILQVGTPSWVTPNYRRFWKSCITHSKHISFLGIGLAVPYELDFWYGREAFIQLKDSGLIDLIVCRDKFCYYWLAQRCGIDAGKIHILPCPGFYILKPQAVRSKKKVVFSIANPVTETSRQTDLTFQNYYERCKYTIEELEKSGVEVYVTYQRSLPDYPAFAEEYEQKFPGRPLTWFPDSEAFIEFHKDKDIYIGVRNHGALPCAGAGKPSLLLGTDYRQFLADEIPFLSRYDISHGELIPRFVLTWYHSLDADSISASLIRWRVATFNRWREILQDVIEILGGI